MDREENSMKTNDYVKYMTEQLVSYVDQPRDVRKAIKAEKKEYKAPMSFRLFGLIPIAFSIAKERRRSIKGEKHS